MRGEGEDDAAREVNLDCNNDHKCKYHRHGSRKLFGLICTWGGNVRPRLR